MIWNKLTLVYFSNDLKDITVDSNNKKDTAVKQDSTNINESLNTNEFVSDSYDHEALNDEDLKNELKQLKLNNNNNKKDG